jgi:hypothetical protein
VNTCFWLLSDGSIDIGKCPLSRGKADILGCRRSEKCYRTGITVTAAGGYTVFPFKISGATVALTPPPPSPRRPAYPLLHQLAPMAVTADECAFEIAHRAGWGRLCSITVIRRSPLSRALVRLYSNARLSTIFSKLASGMVMSQPTVQL